MIVASDETFNLYSTSKNRKLYTFKMQRNWSRCISKDGRYVADLAEDGSLVVLERTIGGNFKIMMQLADISDYCIDNDQALLAVQDRRNFKIYDLKNKDKPIYVAQIGYSCFVHVSKSREYLVRHVWAESEMHIYSMSGGGRLTDRWISCDQVEFIGDANILYYITRGSELRKHDCDTGQDIRLLAFGNNFCQSPSSKIIAAKVGYYTNVKDPQYVQFYKDGVPFTRFDNMDEVDYFLREDLLAAIVVRDVPGNKYESLYTGVLYETKDGWQTFNQIARIDDCHAFFINEDGNVCAVVDESTEWKTSFSVQQVFAR